MVQKVFQQFHKQQYSRSGKMEKTNQTKEDYCLIRTSNAVVKWTSIITSAILDYDEMGGNFYLLQEFWDMDR